MREKKSKINFDILTDEQLIDLEGAIFINWHETGKVDDLMTYAELIMELTLREITI